MKFRKRSLLVLTIIMLSLVLTTLTPTAAQDKVTIRWLSHTYEPWNVALQAQADQYMADHPNVEIVYSYVLHADLNVEIATQLAAGDPPTIMGVYGPWMPQLLEANALAPAPDWVLEDLDANFPPVMKEAATYNDQVWAYVQHIGIPMPIINVKMFADNNLTEPKTWDDVLAIDNQLADQGLYGMVLDPTKNGSWDVINWSGILMAYGGQILNDDLTAAAFNSEAGLSATQIYKQLAHNAEIIPADAFETEFSAMMESGPWQKSSFEADNPDLQYKALLPMAGPAGQVTSSYVWFWVVSSAASEAEQQAAWEFLSWASAGDQYANIYRSVGLLPITNTLPAEFANDPWVQTFNEGLKYAKIYYAKHPKWEQIDVAIGEELERVAVGEISPEDFLSIAEKRVNDILSS
jgi:multiple sugar transport system substrate-binding protein